MESWLKMSCPHCQQTNWHNEGDVDDVTVLDIEAVKCWNCGQRFFLDEEDVIDRRELEIRSLYRDNDRDERSFDYNDLADYLNRGAFCAWGRRNPDDPYKSIYED